MQGCQGWLAIVLFPARTLRHLRPSTRRMRRIGCYVRPGCPQAHLQRGNARPVPIWALLRLVWPSMSPTLPPAHPLSKHTFDAPREACAAATRMLGALRSTALDKPPRAAVSIERCGSTNAADVHLDVLRLLERDPGPLGRGMSSGCEGATVWPLPAEVTARLLFARASLAGVRHSQVASWAMTDG